VSVEITQAEASDLPGIARLLWLDTPLAGSSSESIEHFATALTRWWHAHTTTHVCFVARLDGPELVGMAWIAMVPRVPRPGAIRRMSGDVQAVFVLPAHRRAGIGGALVDAASNHAEELGAVRVTVHSGRNAVPVYERLGFVASSRLLQRPPD
jgi:GNAT superfamily N-acetyltransferase